MICPVTNDDKPDFLGCVEFLYEKVFFLPFYTLLFRRRYQPPSLKVQSCASIFKGAISTSTYMFSIYTLKTLNVRIGWL